MFTFQQNSNILFFILILFVFFYFLIENDNKIIVKEFKESIIVLRKNIKNLNNFTIFFLLLIIINFCMLTLILLCILFLLFYFIKIFYVFTKSFFFKEKAFYIYPKSTVFFKNKILVFLKFFIFDLPNNLSFFFVYNIINIFKNKKSNKINLFEIFFKQIFELITTFSYTTFIKSINIFNNFIFLKKFTNNFFILLDNTISNVIIDLELFFEQFIVNKKIIIENNKIKTIK